MEHNPVVVIGDSTIDLGEKNYKKYDIKIIPLIVREGENVFHDGVDLTPDELYLMVERTGRLPQTASEAPGVIATTFKEWVDKGYDVVYVGIGSKLSSCFESAKVAASEFEGRVFLIDSENLSSAAGLLALKCCKLRDEGKSAKEIAETVQKMSPKVVGQFTVERLDYLHKGGRCSGLAKVFGNLFKIRPYLRVIDGKLIVYKKLRGKMEKAIIEQVNGLRDDLPNVDMDHILITSAGATPEIRNFFYKEVTKLVSAQVVMETRAGCVISSHCGFGTIGLLYIKK